MRTTEQSVAIASISPAMKGIFDQHFATVWRFMALHGVRPAQIDDLVHVVFRVIREHPRRYETGSPCKLFVCVVARQVLRQLGRLHTMNAYPWARDNASGARSAARSDALHTLHSMMESMTEEEREVYVLADGEGLSSAEVAEVLGISETGAQRKLESARQVMRSSAPELVAPSAEARRLPEVSELLSAARACCTPTARDRDRVFAAMIAQSLKRLHRRERLEASHTVPVPVPLEARRAELGRELERKPPKPERQSPSSLMLWGVAAGAVLICGVGGYCLAWSAPAVVSSAALASPPPSVVSRNANHRSGHLTEDVAVDWRVPEAHGIEELEEVSFEPATSAGSELSRSRTHDGSAARVAEAKALLLAEQAYHRGAVDSVLASLARLERRYPFSAFKVERNALRAQALCAQGKFREAWAITLQLEADKAPAATLESVRGACQSKDAL